MEECSASIALQQPLGATPLTPVFLLNAVTQDHLILEVVPQGQTFFIPAPEIRDLVKLDHLGEQSHAVVPLLPPTIAPQPFKNCLVLLAIERRYLSCAQSGHEEADLWNNGFPKTQHFKQPVLKHEPRGAAGGTIPTIIFDAPCLFYTDSTMFYLHFVALLYIFWH
jgi:hypothetical protein